MITTEWPFHIYLQNWLTLKTLNTFSWYKLNIKKRLIQFVRRTSIVIQCILEQDDAHAKCLFSVHIFSKPFRFILWNSLISSSGIYSSRTLGIFVSFNEGESSFLFTLLDLGTKQWIPWILCRKYCYISGTTIATIKNQFLAGSRSKVQFPRRTVSFDKFWDFIKSIDLQSMGSKRSALFVYKTYLVVYKRHILSFTSNFSHEFYIIQSISQCVLSFVYCWK